MSQKIRRRDLKRNELADTMGRTVGYVTEHRRGVTEAVAILAGVAVLVGGFFVYREWSARSAGKALSEALSILDVPLASEPDAAGAAKTYPNDAARRKDANVFLEKAARHGSTSPGRAAQVLLAAGGADKPGQTVDAFEKAARQGRSETAAAAEIDAAKLLASQGKASEAIERLKRAIDAPNSPAPRDALLYTLGQIYETSGAPADARAAYQRLINEYPSSPYRAEARQKVPLS
jgi:tetratricopeptide (TPR) repeat protein